MSVCFTLSIFQAENVNVALTYMSDSAKSQLHIIFVLLYVQMSSIKFATSSPGILHSPFQLEHKGSVN